jgi:hypothetical protein
VLGGWMDSRQRTDQLEVVTLRAACDQCVEPILGAECFGHVGPATGEPGKSPLISILRVRGVPGLMGTVEVAYS